MPSRAVSLLFQVARIKRLLFCEVVEAAVVVNQLLTLITSSTLTRAVLFPQLDIETVSSWLFFAHLAS